MAFSEFAQLAQFAQRKILGPFSTYPLNIRGVNAFATRYTRRYAYASTASKLIDFPGAALYPKFERRWQTRQEPLWWNVTTRKDFEHKRVVRSWVARRVRQAFVESLRKSGYAQDGSRITGSGDPLVGTTQLFPERPILNMKFEEVVLQTDKVVQAIIDLEDSFNEKKGALGGKKKLFPKYTKKEFKPPEPERQPFRRIKY